ncbi:hypothetical protein [Deinococcus arenicola]|uniref:DUF2339 domain-containing protein n=1 Tax=Deinococcus arenicola TaxID=2994950 RepID=A0ABU4DPV3_9DEIO|nr:hypothetical protein [Deinococcus sp. ZS9-10]MDV6374398.1 hypothetical protein [Deinococcus sp. ZS9-10]
MSELLAVLALILSFVALSRANKAREQARHLAQRLEVLEAGLRGVRLPAAPTTLAGEAPPIHMPPGTPVPEAISHAWPEDQPTTLPIPAAPLPAPFKPPRPRGPSLWGPEFSRARISLIGGVLVLGGLAFTLRALNAPGWTLLVAVFAFGGLLYFNARRVPWPVSGALRGLGYGVAALGMGSLSAQLPGNWGPGAVMLGLLGLSVALLLDALRRRELLLGALAVGGAALSTWMLTDDLGRWSIPAAGAAILLAAVAVWQGRTTQDAVQDDSEDGELNPDAPAARRAALALTLSAAGAVPVGWLVASLSHVGDGRWNGAEEKARAALQLTDGPLSLLPWLAFSVLALSVPLALLSRLRQEQEDDSGEDRADGVALGAAWAVLIPQALVAAAVGAALRGQAGSLALSLAILAALVGAARLAWTRQKMEDSPLASAVAGGLTAGATGIAGALALSVLGPRTEPLALASVAAALLLVGLYGKSRFWVRAGALGLGYTALWGMWTPIGHTPGYILDDLRVALLGAAPAVLGLGAAWRLGRDGWANLPRPPRELKTAGQKTGRVASASPRLTPTGLAPLCSAALSVALLAAGSAVLAAGVLLAAALLWTRKAGRTGHTVPFWIATPLLTLGSLLLLINTTSSLLLLGSVVALTAGAALLRATPRTFAEPSPRVLAEVAALIVLALALGRPAQEWWPALGVPGALALLAVLTAPLKLTLSWGRMDVLLGLGAVLLLGTVLAGWPGEFGTEQGRLMVAVVGAVLLAAAWWLTRMVGGLRVLDTLTRPFGGLPPNAGAQTPVARALWLGGWALLLPLALGTRFSPQAADLRPWLIASSVALLAVGLVTAVQAHRAGGAAWARALWTAGLGLIAGAGIKGAFLDASSFPKSSAGLGVAVLLSGLSLLAVAILAPRPPALTPASAQEKL